MAGSDPKQQNNHVHMADTREFPPPPPPTLPFPPRVALFCLQLALLKPGQRDGPQQRVSGQRNHRRGPAVARLANRVLRGAELVDARLRWVVNGASRGRVERPQQPGSRPPVRAA